MSKRLLAFLVVIIVVIVTIMGIFRGFRAKEQQALSMMPTVEVAKAQKAMWQDQINATGTISALNGVMIKPEVSGRLTKIYFESGDYVQQGQPLFQIYPDILEAQLQSNEAALAYAQVDYQRAVDLYAKRVVSQQQLDTQTNNLRNAQAAVDGTKAQLVQHNIIAPVSGRLGLKYVDVGDFVNVGDKMVNLQQIDPLRIEFSVPDRFINEVKIGDKVNIMPSSTPDAIYVGNVYALDSAVDISSQSFSMWAQIPNPYHQLLPGAYVYITLFAGKPKPVITVPQTAVVYSPQGSYVFKIVDNKAAKTQVTPGERYGDDIQVIDGLNAGDVVVTAGQVKIFDGSEVKISPNQTYENENTPQPEMITFDTKPRPEQDKAAASVNNPESATVSALPTTNPADASATSSDAQTAPAPTSPVNPTNTNVSSSNSIQTTTAPAPSGTTSATPPVSTNNQATKKAKTGS